RRGDSTAALAEALLPTGSPPLEDLTAGVLDRLASRTRGHLRHSLGRLSRALEHLGLVHKALPRGPAPRELEARLNTADVPPTWAEWCLRWYRSADLRRRRSATTSTCFCASAAGWASTIPRSP